ncbi:NAD(P)H-hydrate dehydratase [Methylophaga sp. OBS3]|uniref:NAD(P)H-hydrate dehydratase n=1 Tax=Methylophaga sp. OBS3 TaxID=2991934 RepID=UPI0022548ECF|nr:NAD(P)H-hydrate dehydratase [Methylophaga sp. OBS3]MCX4190454.1 NAD(P)H-hydrate dehydratase [Methylophaga sp. OBS3]
MSILPNALYSAAQTRELDRLAFEQHQLSSPILMARAGKAALKMLQQQWPFSRNILIVCGHGHNGGDGFELAKQATQAGFSAHIVFVGAIDSMSEAVKASYQSALTSGIQIQTLQDEWPESDLLVDALLGTGINREVSGDYGLAIDKINSLSNTPVFALDIPSGLNADTGSVMGKAVKADKTLSFIGINIGLMSHDGPDHAGEIHYVDLAVPADIFSQISPLANRISLDALLPNLAPRKRNAHKGQFGHVLIIGGNEGMSGSVNIAAQAAARTGAGLVSVATHPSHAAFLNLSRPEIMCHGINQASDLSPLIDKATVICIGPGLGQDEWAQLVLHAALAAEKPMVVDADALNLLSQHPSCPNNWVLTPHPGEAATLLGISNSEVQNNRIEAAHTLQKKYGGTVVLKGCGSLVCSEDGLLLSPFGNPGMSSGGMGDCLTGIIGGLLAQHFPIKLATQMAVALHGLAADNAAKVNGECGLLALDLLPFLQRLINQKD